jgi:hypothetical protein
MAVPGRVTGRLWAGRAAAGLVLAGLVLYLAWVGLDKADKIASCLSLLLATGLALAPHLLSTPEEDPSRPAPDWVVDTGKAVAEDDDATAVTGAQVEEGSGPVWVESTGDAHASGSGSTAVSGIQRLPRERQ